MQQQLSSVQQTVSSVQQTVAAVRGDVAAVRGDVAAVRGDVTAVQRDATAVRQTVSTLEGKVDRIATNQGHLFEAVVRATPREQPNKPPVYEQLPQLLSDCGLPSSAAAAVHLDLARPSVLHTFRRRLAEHHWRAASQDAAAGAAQPSAMLALLESAPQPGTWPAAMTLLMVASGSLQPGLGLNMPLLVQHGPQGTVHSVTVEQSSIAGSEAGAAKEQLARSIRAIGWAFAAAGQPPPLFVGTVIVPAGERRLLHSFV
ncbi:hypothetical protein ABPG75_005285 [Micractinium tetrahymenae]